MTSETNADGNMFVCAACDYEDLTSESDTVMEAIDQLALLFSHRSVYRLEVTGQFTGQRSQVSLHVRGHRPVCRSEVSLQARGHKPVYSSKVTSQFTQVSKLSYD